MALWLPSGQVDQFLTSHQPGITTVSLVSCTVSFCTSKIEDYTSFQTGIRTLKAPQGTARQHLRRAPGSCPLLARGKESLNCCYSLRFTCIITCKFLFRSLMPSTLGTVLRVSTFDLAARCVQYPKLPSSFASRLAIRREPSAVQRFLKTLLAFSPHFPSSQNSKHWMNFSPLSLPPRNVCPEHLGMWGDAGAASSVDKFVPSKLPKEVNQSKIPC